MIRRENNHEDCIKFLDRKEFDNFGMKLEEYEIHKCDRAVFGETYLKASIKVACEASLNPRDGLCVRMIKFMDRTVCISISMSNLGFNL